MLTRRADFAGWAVGALVAIAATQALQSFTAVHFSYHFPIALFLVVALGYAASFRPGRRPAAPHPGLTVWDRHRPPL